VIDLDTLLVRSDGVVSAPMGDGMAMMDLESGQYFVLTEVAAEIWDRLAEPVPVSALCAALAGVYDVSPEQCRDEVLSFLETTHAKGLIRVVE
jgi:hypothetical protein